MRSESMDLDHSWLREGRTSHNPTRPPPRGVNFSRLLVGSCGRYGWLRLCQSSREMDKIQSCRPRPLIRGDPTGVVDTVKDRLPCGCLWSNTVTEPFCTVPGGWDGQGSRRRTSQQRVEDTLDTLGTLGSSRDTDTKDTRDEALSPATKKERKKRRTQGRDGRTARHHHTGTHFKEGSVTRAGRLGHKAHRHFAIRRPRAPPKKRSPPLSLPPKISRGGRKF